MKASLKRWHKEMTTLFISAKAGDHDIALTNSEIVSKTNYRKR